MTGVVKKQSPVEGKLFFYSNERFTIVLKIMRWPADLEIAR
jgi:hypothetical protein